MAQLTGETRFDTRQLLVAKGSAWRVYKRLLGYAWEYKGRLLVSVLFAFIVAASFSSVIVTVGTAINLLYADEAAVHDDISRIARKVGGAADWLEPLTGRNAETVEANVREYVSAMRANRSRTLYVLSGAVVAIALVGGLARFLQEYFAGAIGAYISVRLGEEMFANLMRMSIAFFERRTTGEILARFTNDIFMVNRGLANTFVKLFREPIKLVFYLTLALSVDWALTLTVLLVIPFVAYVIVTVGRKVKKSMRRSLQKIASMAGVAAETFNGILIVKAYNMEQYETGRVNTEFGKLRRYLIKMVKADAAIEPATEFLLVVGLVVFIVLASRAIESAHLTMGDLTILSGSLIAMMDPLRKLSAVNNMIQASVASAERVFEFIDMPADIVEVPEPVELPPLRHAIRFNDVHFSYDGQTEVLRGIDIEIRKGEMVALVGFSGAGKSTIVKLIPRFYEVSGGAITIDGVDVRQASFQSLRDQISIVTQDTILFNESVRGNIAFGREVYSVERIRQAAEAARAAEFITKLPEGYDTVIGESGGTLSGGQRQRLAIARAIVKDPAILILDEATSSLDSESEQAIQRAIEEFIVGRTTIVIAHRLSTVQRADRILVIDDGRVVEEGSHEALIRKEGLYRRLYDVQFASPEKKGPA